MLYQKAFGEHYHIVNDILNAFIINVDWIITGIMLMLMLCQSSPKAYIIY